MSRQDATAALRDVMEELGEPPSASEYREQSADSHPSVRSMYNWYDDAERPWLAAIMDALGFIDPSTDDALIRLLADRFDQPAVEAALHERGIEWHDRWQPSDDPEYEIATGELEENLRAAAAMVGEPLTRHKYQAWRERDDGEAPHRMTIIKRFDGSWQNACRAAGVESGGPRERH